MQFFSNKKLKHKSARIELQKGEIVINKSHTEHNNVTVSRTACQHITLHITVTHCMSTHDSVKLHVT